MIVAAERQELAPLSRRLTGAQPLDLGVSWSLAGRLGSLPVVLATNRPGRRNAAAAVHRVAARLSLRGIVSIGDVVKSRLEDMELETNVLRDYAVAHQ